jgi:DNA polymerase-3 subunit alpha
MEMDEKKELKAVKRILGCHIYIDTGISKPSDKSSYNRLTLLRLNSHSR